jgi:hypothetical protein
LRCHFLHRSFVETTVAQPTLSSHPTLSITRQYSSGLTYLRNVFSEVSNRSTSATIIHSQNVFRGLSQEGIAAPWYRRMVLNGSVQRCMQVVDGSPTEIAIHRADERSVDYNTKPIITTAATVVSVERTSYTIEPALTIPANFVCFTTSTNRQHT